MLAWLQLRDFRSYPELEFTPDPGVNILVGHNGAGKTNVLEAIAYLGRLRSFRRAPDASLVRSGAPAAVVRGGLDRPEGEARIEIEIPASGRRTVRRNGKRPARYAELLADAPCVAFLPDDLDLVKRGPALRREYVDDLVERLSPVAAQDVAEFTQALRQRNALLRRAGPDANPASLDVWDEQVAGLGGRVIRHRLDLLARAGEPLRTAHRSVAGGEHHIDLSYEAPWAGAGVGHDASADEWGRRLGEVLGERRRRDTEQRTTTAGPQRDDVMITIDGRDARTRASQGEQRSLAVALRIAAYRLLTARYGRAPILLLDDVFSELDRARRDGVAAMLPDGQVFVTSARQDEVSVDGARWRVEPGRVERE